MFVIYLLINEDKNRTYVGFSDKIKSRINEHKNRKVKTTKNFGNFSAYKIDTAVSLVEARDKEKYWKSCAGRKKPKVVFNNLAPSSNG